LIVRTLHWFVGLAVLAVCGIGTFRVLMPGEADRLRKEKEAIDQQRIELQRAVERLTGEDRLAEVHVLDQVRGTSPQAVTTTLEFLELDRQQHPLPARRFTVHDEVIFFDALVLKFDHEKVAAGDALRGKSLALFRRVYGEHQRPSEGFAIDPQGQVPHLFAVQPEPGELERRLWKQFWDYAADPQLAAADGVRVAQGEAVYVPMRKGQAWTLTLQNNGGLNIKLHRPLIASRPATD